MDIQSLLNNDTVKSTLQKFGVDEDKQSAVINQAMEVIKSKGLDNPQGLMSLMSSSPNSAEDNKFQSVLENDFVKGLISKVGLSDDAAKKIAGALPELMKNIDMSMITSLIGSFKKKNERKSKTRNQKNKTNFADLSKLQGEIKTFITAALQKKVLQGESNSQKSC